MTKKFTLLRVSYDVKDMLIACEKEYRRHHPELAQINLSKNKIIYETCKYYLENP